MTRPSQGEPGRTSSIAAAEAPVSDFIDASPPPSPPSWPPLGAYPGEPGHPGPPEWPPTAAPPGDTASATEVIPAVVGSTSDALHGETVEGEVVWHQPPPSEPFHAKHEKPGEWHTHPPDHLAFEHSPPAEVQPGVQHDQPTEAIPLSMLPHPWEVPFDPSHTETGFVEESARRPRRTGLWVTLALVVTLLLFGGGTLSAVLLLRNADSGKGSPDPATAVDRFLTSVYTQQDATSAGEHVCREARDEDKIQQRVDQIKGYANEYQAPTYRWSEPAVSGQDEEKAMVAVQLTMTTDDEKTAQQQLTFTVVRKTGWLVCDVAG
ncbi:hypothetical protein AB0M36_27045 [Actinoplanes sp. NPDC051346]|uniref:Rv0361 family membrane protein n=1 Tax=Actinoplanes sp. NPDC051346 TaxID=3155048 RepID=UPI0034372039